MQQKKKPYWSLRKARSNLKQKLFNRLKNKRPSEISDGLFVIKTQSSALWSKVINASCFSGDSARKYFNNNASCGETAPPSSNIRPCRSHSPLVSSHFASVSILSGVGIERPTNQWWKAYVLTDWLGWRRLKRLARLALERLSKPASLIAVFKRSLKSILSCSVCIIENYE